MNNTIERTWRQYGLTFVEDLRGTGFTAESGAHTFIISGVDTDNNPITLSGTVAASFIRPDGTTTAMTGSISAGKAHVTLSAECYGVAGRGTLTIFLTSGGQKVAIYSAVLNIVRSNTSQVSPAVTADVVDLVNRIDTATASIPSTYTNLLASLAADYSSSATYKAGDYVWYNGYLYKANQDISTAESWTAAHWTRVVMSTDLISQITDLKSALNNITTLKQIANNNVFGYFTSTTLQYWRASANSIFYFPCEANKQYKITKNWTPTAYAVAYIKQEPANGVQQPVYNYVSPGTSNNDLDYTTGDGALYVLILVGTSVGTNTVTTSLYAVDVDTLEGQVDTLEGQVDTLEDAVSMRVTEDIYPDLTFTSGYMAKDGQTYSSESLKYSNSIPVASGDVLRFSSSSSSSFRFVTAFNGSQAVVASGAESVATYTVPDGITAVVVTIYTTATNLQIYHTFDDIIDVAELKSDVAELKSDVAAVIYHSYGYFTSTTLQYWEQTAWSIAYFACKPQKAYTIRKTIESPVFTICYIKETPVRGTQQAVYGYTEYAGTTTEITFNTGDDALYVLILIGNALSDGDRDAIIASMSATSVEIVIKDDVARSMVTYDDAYLPSNLYLIVNKDYEIYHDQICPNAQNYTFKWSGGTHLGNRVRLNYSATGNNGLTCNIYNADGTLARQISTVVHVVSITESNVYLLPFGDSLTNHCVWESELMNMAENIHCVGARSRQVRDSDNELRTVYDEGRAGFTSFNYTSGASYGSSASDTGGLESPHNRWYDPTNEVFSTAYYFATNFPNDQTEPNALTFFLGMNDLLGSNTVEQIVANIKNMIDDIRSYNSSLSIVLMTPQLRYLPTLNSNERYLFVDFAKKMETLASSYSNMAFLPLLIGMDSVNNYNTRSVTINTRSTATELMASDITHPANLGYWQIADYVLGALSYLIP